MGQERNEIIKTRLLSDILNEHLSPIAGKPILIIGPSMIPLYDISVVGIATIHNGPMLLVDPQHGNQEEQLAMRRTLGYSGTIGNINVFLRQFKLLSELGLSFKTTPEWIGPMGSMQHLWKGATEADQTQIENGSIALIHDHDTSISIANVAAEEKISDRSSYKEKLLNTIEQELLATYREYFRVLEAKGKALVQFNAYIGMQDIILRTLHLAGFTTKIQIIEDAVEFQIKNGVYQNITNIYNSTNIPVEPTTDTAILHNLTKIILRQNPSEGINTSTLRLRTIGFGHPSTNLIIATKP